MPKKTKSKVSTVTNTQIMLATLAAFLANGLALAALPVTKLPPPKQALSCTAQVTGSGKVCKLKNNIIGYRSFLYTCPNGKTFKVTSSCRTSVSLQKIANDKCTKKNYCLAAVIKRDVEVKKVEAPAPVGYGYGYNVVPPTTQGTIRSMTSPNLLLNFSDIAFVGSPEQNVTLSYFDNKVNIKVRYTNRGPAPLAPSEQVDGGTHLIMTFLNEKQEIIPVDPNFLTTNLEALLPGQSFEKTFTVDGLLSKSMADRLIKFIKFDIHVGKREVGGKGTFDPNILNNTIIFEIPQIPFPLGKDTL